jgi:MFS transporter, NNP family, nitrate/nitrite transporter
VRDHTIHDWRPNDPGFWHATGRRVAQRNLTFSILAEFLGFSVWLLWSVMAVNLKNAGFDYTTEQLFWLVSLPALVGATLRLPYGAAVPIVGGRNFTIFSAAVLVVPTVGLALVVQDPSTPYWLMLLVAATAGFGGGNFASSMANISYFYPDSRKGWALGLNAAGGNIGVSFVQLVVPAMIGLGVLGLGGNPSGAELDLRWAGWMWLPLIALATACAYFFMDNLSVSRASLGEQAIILYRSHTWLISFLYIGTFGSFIGYSAALPLLIKLQFPELNPLQYAFLGPLVGSLARPVGGALSDRYGGATVTFWNFLVMFAAALGVIATLTVDSFVAFLMAFLVLFVTSGIGNGSTFRIVPTVFLRDRLAEAVGRGEAARAAAERAGRFEAAAVLAFSSAIGAYGGFLIPQGFSRSITITGGPELALYTFAAFYMACLAVTWWCYVRTASDTEPAKAAVAMAGQRADQASSAHAAAAILPQGKILSRNEPLTFTLKNIEPDHPSVKALGIQEDILTGFGVGYYRGRGMMENHIVIPVFNTSRQPVAYAGFHPEEHTYTYPPKFRRELELYNLAGALTDHGADQGVILVRHPLEALTLISAGFTNSAALMGDTLSEEQREMLLAKYKAGEKVTLFWPTHADVVPTLSALLPNFFVRLRRYKEKGGTPFGFIAEDVPELLA